MDQTSGPVRAPGLHARAHLCHGELGRQTVAGRSRCLHVVAVTFHARAVSRYVDDDSACPLLRQQPRGRRGLVVGVSVDCLLAAYSISRYRFRGRQTFSVVVLSTQMFPGILFLLPLFVMFVNISNVTGINLYGSRLGLILTFLTFTLPFAIWMLIGYLDSIPRELDEAALVEGNGPLGALFRVVVPAAIPGIVAVAIYAFMTAWGEVLFASIM